MEEKYQSGSFSIEAAISIYFFLLFSMFIISFAQVYRAQNFVTHGLLETGKYMAFQSYDDSQFSYFESILDFIIDGVTGNTDRKAIRDAYVRDNGNLSEFHKLFGSLPDYKNAAKIVFGYCASESPEMTSDILKQYGLKDGIDSIKFTEVKMDGDDIVILVEYQVKLPIAFFNYKYINLRQNVKCALWK